MVTYTKEEEQAATEFYAAALELDKAQKKYEVNAPGYVAFDATPTPATPTPATPAKAGPLKLPPRKDWGVRFSKSNDDSFYFVLLPAINSTLPIQGSRDVPNVMPGVSFTFKPNLAKFRIPGSVSAFQNLGIDTVMVTFCGCFSGADGETLGKNTIEDKAKIDTFKDLNEFYDFAYIKGQEFEIEIRVLILCLCRDLTGEIESFL